MTKKEWKSGDRVMIAVLVPATLSGLTNQNSPTGNWWVLLDGEVGLRGVHEDEFHALAESSTDRREG